MCLSRGRAGGIENWPCRRVPVSGGGIEHACASVGAGREGLKIGPVGGFLHRAEALSMCLCRGRAGGIENWPCRRVPVSVGGIEHVPQ